MLLTFTHLLFQRLTNIHCRLGLSPVLFRFQFLYLMCLHLLLAGEDAVRECDTASVVCPCSVAAAADILRLRSDPQCAAQCHSLIRHSIQKIHHVFNLHLLSFYFLFRALLDVV